MQKGEQRTIFFFKQWQVTLNPGREKRYVVARITRRASGLQRNAVCL